ncbi:ABC transporter phosphate binding protein [Campylobacter geochelonis]|nr:ABC transporter phosphate binding protein [Campylobacter geochelonis]
MMRGFLLLFLSAVYAFSLSIDGCGATFVTHAFDELSKAYQKKTNISITYTPIGSSGGIKQVLRGKADFGLSELEYKLEDNSYQLIPFVKGNISLVYNLDGVDRLVLDADVISQIYLGKITMWSDERIKALNLGVNLPDKKINVVHRYDGSGTTFAFTSFLDKNSKEWRDKFGVAMALDWAVGVGKKGNLGVSEAIKQTPNSLGYVGYSHARNFGLKKANLAYNDKIYSSDKKGYPLRSFSYFFLKIDGEKSQDVRRFIDFIYRSGDEIINESGLIPLDENDKVRLSIR